MLFVGALLLLLAGPAQAAGGGDHHLEPLTWDTINWFTWSSEQPPLGWFILDFAFFALLLWWYGKRPIRQAFAQRHVQVKRALEEAASAFANAEGRYEEYKGKLANVEQEANRFVEAGRQDGGLERDQIVQAAKQYSERLRQDSSAVQRQEIDKARLRLRREVATEVLEITEKTLRDQLNDGDRTRLIEEAIDELENGKELARAAERMAAAQPGGAG
jgi:F-type H+-transporting ATPase subunit b